MLESVQLGDELTDSKYEAQTEPGAKKGRTSNIATLDNDTMVEVLKHLSYRQLAKSSFISKRFWNLIRIHRNKLARLYVEDMAMNSGHRIIRQNDLLKDYSEWAIRNQYRNQYSKQIPLESQVAEEENTQNKHEFYYFRAYSGQGLKDLFFANAELNHENWPLFQHFVGLLTDPFIYICSLQLDLQNDVINLLCKAINPDGKRIQCRELTFSPKGNVQKFINWTKNALSCERIQIRDRYMYAVSKFEEWLLDLLVSGLHCTSQVYIICHGYYKLFRFIVDFVQKFMELKSSDEYQMVEFIHGYANEGGLVDLLKRDYAKFIVKKDNSSEKFFEFVNNDVGKKLTISILKNASEYSLKISNLE